VKKLVGVTLTFEDGSQVQQDAEWIQREIQRRVDATLAPILESFDRFVQATRGRAGGRKLEGGSKRPGPDVIWMRYTILQLKNPGRADKELRKMLLAELLDVHPEERTVRRWIAEALDQ
jgi:hypothetical protein